jgi:hypothetical protein
MRPINRKLTYRGVGSTECVEDSEPSSESGVRPAVTCPPPSVASSRPASRYSLVAPTRETVSMLATPVPSDDAPDSRRRPTMRMPVSVECVDVRTPSVRDVLAAATAPASARARTSG